jgi:hypothetical protein
MIANVDEEKNRKKDVPREQREIPESLKENRLGI